VGKKDHQITPNNTIYHQRSPFTSEGDFNDINNIHNTPNIIKYPPNNINIEESNKEIINIPKNKIICQYCSKIEYKSHIKRHYRNSCLLIPENKRNFFIQKYKTDKRHIKNNNDLQIIENHNINSNNQINSNNTTNTTNTTNNNTNTNTTNNTNNIQNNIQNNITLKLNNFGEEDISSLGKKDILLLINRAYKMIPDTMKAIHYDIPENRNMYIPNINRPLVKIYKDGDWVYKSLDYVSDMVSSNMKTNIEEWTSKYDLKLSNLKKKALNEFVSKCLDGKMENEFRNELKLFLMTYSNDIKDQLNKEFVKKLELLVDD